MRELFEAKTEHEAQTFQEILAGVDIDSDVRQSRGEGASVWVLDDSYLSQSKDILSDWFSEK